MRSAYGVVAYPSDVDSVFREVLEHVGVGVASIAGDHEAARGGQGLAQVRETGLGHGIEALLFLLLFILLALELGGFFHEMPRRAGSLSSV